MPSLRKSYKSNSKTWIEHKIDEELSNRNTTANIYLFYPKC
jgi:hypothetical protein